MACTAAHRSLKYNTQDYLMYRSQENLQKIWVTLISCKNELGVIRGLNTRGRPEQKYKSSYADTLKAVYLDKCILYHHERSFINKNPSWFFPNLLFYVYLQVDRCYLHVNNIVGAWYFNICVSQTTLKFKWGTVSIECHTNETMKLRLLFYLVLRLTLLTKLFRLSTITVHTNISRRV